MPSQTRTKTRIPILVIIVTLCCICSVTAALQPPQSMQTNPDDTYIISTTDSSIAYTQTFIDDYKNGKYPIIEFDGDYHFIPYKNQIENNPFSKYIELNTQYLLKNPESKIKTYSEETNFSATIAESYTDRDPKQTYPGDKFVASQYNKSTKITTTVYIHTTELEKSVTESQIFSTYTSNPTQNKFINGIYGPNYIFESNNPTATFGLDSRFTVNFLQSQHVKKRTLTYQKALYYTQKPNLETIIDYILNLQPETHVNLQSTDVILNLDGHEIFSNNEIIAYTTPIDPNLPLAPIGPTSTEIIKNKNWMKNYILIKKTQINNKTIGLFINAEKINTLEPEIQSRTFGWICTKPHNKYLQWYNTIWGPTYYKPTTKEPKIIQNNPK